MCVRVCVQIAHLIDLVVCYFVAHHVGIDIATVYFSSKFIGFEMSVKRNFVFFSSDDLIKIDRIYLGSISMFAKWMHLNFLFSNALQSIRFRSLIIFFIEFGLIKSVILVSLNFFSFCG